MSHVDPFQLSTPPGSQDPRLGDDRIRELKRALKERFLVGGMYFEDSGTPDDDAGKICASIQSANVLQFFETNKTTVMAQFSDSSKDLQLGDGLVQVNPYRITANEGRFNKLDIGLTGNAAASVVRGDFDVLSPGEVDVSGAAKVILPTNLVYDIDPNANTHAATPLTGSFATAVSMSLTTKAYVSTPAPIMFWWQLLIEATSTGSRFDCRLMRDSSVVIFQYSDLQLGYYNASHNAGAVKLISGMAFDLFPADSTTHTYELQVRLSALQPASSANLEGICRLDALEIINTQKLA